MNQKQDCQEKEEEGEYPVPQGKFLDGSQFCKF